MDILSFILVLLLIGAVFILFKQNQKLKKGSEKPKFDISSEITKLKSIGELSVYKIHSKEIISRKDSPINSKFWKTILGWSMTKKQMVVIFEFEIDFIYDLRSSEFSITQVSEDGDFKIVMPPCRYKFSIKDMKIYDEKNAKILPFLLPDSLNSLFGPGFDENEKNQLIDEAKDEVKTLSINLINSLSAQIHKSAADTLEAIARNFGARGVEFEFRDKSVDKIDVKDSKIELDNAFKKKLIDKF